MNFRRVITNGNSGMCGIPEKRVENTSKLRNIRTNLYLETTTHTPSLKPLCLQFLKGLYFPELIHYNKKKNGKERGGSRAQTIGKVTFKTGLWEV